MKKQNENKKEYETNLVNLSKYNIVLGQFTRNGMKLLTAKYNMSESNIVSMALNQLIKNELSQEEINILHDDPEIDEWVKIEMDANKGLVKVGESSQMPD